MPVISVTTQGVGVDPQGNQMALPNDVALAARGPALQVSISVPDAVAEALARDSKTVPAPKQGVALIDTGASHTCIDQKALEDELDLNPHGFGNTHGVSGPDQRPLFACNLQFLLGANLQPQVFLPSTMGVDLAGQGLIAVVSHAI